MEISRRLENIMPEIEELSEIANEELDTNIIYVIETGSEIEDYEKQVKDVIDTQEGYYDHRPRKFLNIYPNIAPLTSVLLNYRLDDDIYDENVVFSQVIDDMLREVGGEMLSTNSPRMLNLGNPQYNQDLYSNILLELDVNYVKRMSALKNEGGDTLKKLKRDILTAIRDIKDDYAELAKRITNNLLAKFYTLDGLSDKQRFDDNTIGIGAEKDAKYVSPNKMIYERPFLMVMDITLLWYINYKIVHQNVSNKDIFEKIDDFYLNRRRMRDLDAAVFYKRIVESEIDCNDKLINILLKRIELMMYDSSVFDGEELKYKPIFLNQDTEQSYLKCDSNNKTKSDLYNEAANGFIDFDLDISNTIEFMAECLINDSTNLVQESILDIFRKSDSRRITDMAREVDQAEVEFEFMYDRYSKADAMHNAYDILEDIDKAIDKARRRDTKESLEQMRNNLLETIKDYREKDVQKERMNISINYPPGYEG